MDRVAEVKGSLAFWVMKTFRLLSGCFLTLAALRLAASPTLLVPAGSAWRYSADGTDQGTAWRQPAFDDTTWPSGPAQLGWGDGDEVTVLTPGAVTAHFRRPFQSPISAPASLMLRLLRDDGAVVYLNGVEVYRNNMPAGPISYNTLATATVGGPEETTQFVTAPIDPNLLVQGLNVVAVEVHQVTVTSSDLSFDLELTADPGAILPVVNVVATDSDAAESGDLAAIFAGRFTFYRSPVDSNALAVSFLLGGSAENGIDYRYVSNFVRFNPGQVQAQVDIVPLNDEFVEGIENVVLTLQEPVCAAIAPPPPGCYRVGPSNRAEVLIKDANGPQNRQPYVQITQPQDGDVFTAPTNIAIRALAQDAEDGENLVVEFFANGNSIGFGMHVPALCPGPSCPNYQFVWANPEPGSYALTARATDSAGASSNSAPVTIVIQPGQPGTNVALVAMGSVWKYLDNGTDLGTAWRQPVFDDSTWASGPGQLGYGDGDEATVVGFGDPNNKHVTTYFRRSFHTAGTSNISELRGRLLQDDGGAVYLNGVEIFRSNLPAGPIAFNTLAIAASVDNQIVEFTASPVLLREGFNVVAVEMHQNSVVSSDLSFDLELIGQGGTPPPNLPVVTVVATDPDAAESGLLAAIFPGTFTFSRTGATSDALTAFFTLSGSAENGVDYRFVSNSVRFNPGQAQARVDIVPLNDGFVEGVENVVLMLQEPACIAIVPPPPACYRAGSADRAEVFIKDANAPQNQRPYVRLNEPRNGDVFEAPTNIVLRAFATDQEDGYQLTVRFVAGTNSIGTGVFVATTCPAPFCPYYELIWSNVPPGNYAVRAQAIDSSGAISNSASANITVLPPEPGTDVTLIANGSVWKYLDDGTDQGTAWGQPAFNDSTWASGPGQLGYGDGDEATVIGFGPDPSNKYITTYFRNRFHLVNAASFSELRGRLLQDDGAVVYLNGVEVFRSNMPPGPIGFHTLAATVSPDNQIVNFSVPASALVDGVNTVAVEMHQVNPASSDLSFDLELIGAGGPPPPTNRPPHITITSPSDGAEFESPAQVRIEAVTTDPDGYASHVEFFANGQKIGEDSVVFIQPPPPGEPIHFMFTWTNPPAGPHQLTAHTVDNEGAGTGSIPVNIVVVREVPSPSRWVWARQDGGPEFNTIQNLAGDHAGNVYVLGHTSGPMSVGAEELPFYGSSDGYLAKYNNAGRLLWAHSFGGSGYDGPIGLGVDADGNTYVAGQFEGVARFGGHQLTAESGHDLYLLKFTPGGHVVWARSGKVRLGLNNSALAVDAAGNSVVVGQSNTENRIGNIAVGTYGQNDAMIAKFDTFGNVLWATNAGGFRDDRFEGVAIDPSGDIVAIGHYFSNAIVGGTQLVSPNDNELFITKLNANGQVLWARTFPGTKWGGHPQLAADLSGNYYFTLNFYWPITLGGTEFGSVNAEDFALAKLNSNGELLWATSAGGQGFDRPEGLEVDADNRVLVAGSFSQHITLGGITLTSSTDAGFIAKYDEAGAVQWAQKADGAQPGAMGLDAESNVYLGGHFYSVARFGAISLVNTTSQYQSFLAQLGSGISKEDPILNWENPGEIVHGTPLGSDVLDATANVPGTFHYDPPAGTVLPVGADQVLTATFTPEDSHRFNSISIQVTITVREQPAGDRELHAVGIHNGRTTNGIVVQQGGHAAVLVNRPGQRVTLFLSAYWPVQWHITFGNATVIEKVILGGYEAQSVEGIDPSVPIQRLYGGSDYLIEYNIDSIEFQQVQARLCALTGMDLSSFHGSIEAPYPAPFFIDAVQDDPRLDCDYPQPVDPSELPDLNFRLSFHDGSSGNVLHQDYTLAGPRNSSRLLPGHRVVSDGGDRFYYAAERHEVWRVDTATGVVAGMDLGPNVPELSWPMGVAYDSQRNRVLVVSLGGEGFLYGYSPTQAQWSVVSSMNNRDLDCLVYHPADDSLYGLAPTYGGPPYLLRFSPEGVFQSHMALPVQPFRIDSSGFKAELASAGDYLVLLLETDPFFSYNIDRHEARMYLIDPRSGEHWLAYRKVAGADADRDGVPDERDQCPHTPLHTIVDGNGCSADQRDSDGDGVPNGNDQCPGTAPGAVVNTNGCSVPQLCPCDGEWRNHAEYVRCVITHAWEFFRAGLISSDSRREMIRAAVLSACGRRPDRREPAVMHLLPLTSEECRRSGVQLVISGDATGNCTLECSEDLVNWRSVEPVSVTGWEITCPMEPGTKARFYRVRAD